MSGPEFVRLFADSLSGSMPRARIEIADDLQIDVTLNPSRQCHVDLTPAYQSYKSTPEQLNQIIRLYRKLAIANTSLPTSSGNFAIDNIIPLVQNRSQVRHMSSVKTTGGQSGLVSIPLNDELSIVFALNDSLALTYMTETMFASLETSPEILRDFAVSNLMRILPKVQYHDLDGMLMLVANGNFEASLLLFDNLWDGETLPLKGEIVVAAPARDFLLATTSDNEQGLDEMREFVDGAAETFSHFVSDKLFVRRGGSWAIFE
jgi:uncharacterized protein YtpQ (UPF0354 family)